MEVLVASGLIAIAFGSLLVGFTHMNRVASMSRNATGAYTAALKRIDWILAEGPFNPQKKQNPNCVDGILVCPRQIPEERDPNGELLVRLAPGTYTEANVAIYNDPPMVGGVFQFLLPNAPPTFSGLMVTEIEDVSPTPGTAPYFYRAKVTVSYQYLGRGPVWSPARNRWEYQLSMSTLRTSDI